MSNIRANTISDAAGTGPITLTGQSAAKAWVNFNGSGTVAIRDSVNVASLTDNGTGIYTVNFSNSMESTSYTLSGHIASGRLGVLYSRVGAGDRIVNAIRVLTLYPNSLTGGGAYDDYTDIDVVIHGDLA